MQGEGKGDSRRSPEARPHTNPGNRKEYVRRNGPYTLVMSAGGLNKLPFGNMPRLLLAWVCTEVVRTQGRVLILGSSLSDFMRKLEIHPQSGGRNGVRTRLRNQMKRLFDCTVKLIYEDERGKATVNSLIARRKRTTNDRVALRPLLRRGSDGIPRWGSARHGGHRGRGELGGR